MKNFWCVLGISCFLLSSLPAFADQSKLDLMLHDVAKEPSQAASKAMLSKSVSPEGISLLEVLVQSHDTDLTAVAIENVGGEVRAMAGDIMVVAVPSDFLPTLSDREEVRFIEASKPMTSKMNTARAMTNVDDVQGGSVGGTAYTGSEVIVGVIDDGLDYGHPDLLGSDGKTRVQYLKQRKTDGTFAICVKSEIDDASCAITDRGQGTTHGTHVTSIAAGADSTYKGMAPDADIFFIFNSAADAETSGSTTDVTTFSGAIVTGVTDLFQGATLLNKPIVVNLSLGTSLGAHDDTSLLEQGLNNLVGSAGRIIVNAAGNENVNALVLGSNAGGIHADVDVASGDSRAWRFAIISSSISSFGGATVDAWFTSGDSCTIEGRAYTASSSSATTSATVVVGPKAVTSDSAASANTSNDGTAELSLAVDASDTNNSRPHVQITVGPATSGGSFSSIVGNGSTSGYVFDVVIRGDCAGSMWLYPDQTTILDFLTNIDGNLVSGSNSYQLSDGDSNKTMTIPGTASGVITAGSVMETTTTWTDANGTSHDQTNINDDGTGGTAGQVSLFSSLGPTGEISSSRAKPDVVAPGEPIVAALARGASVSNSGKADSTHFKLEGTSMSSPHVAGVVALLLQYNNTLTASQMKSLLKTNATAISGASANAAGSGIVNAEAAFNGTSNDTSSFSGTRDVATSDVNSTGFKSSSTSSSSSKSGCGLIAGNNIVGGINIVIMLLPLGIWMRWRRRFTQSN
ncbi:MAG: hypothetical protein A3I05_00280 [Deltaproteobacteria bacterium RIFCSPLOWO2_02_FULL_44_10]|nr:MAG: hypothetical protein A3C46_01145 [Deltaproteobacteria bacterium RIFCSPHIGHO2_02_FULL_44_16]OGQ47243.1 MAG: hypothetical protein A3I05_00280 [Deltaproteobacteria bacterium RIFCSPLOWO2_02_FULL_44_10]